MQLNFSCLLSKHLRQLRPVYHEVHLHFTVLGGVVSTKDEDHSRNKEAVAEVGVGHNVLQVEESIEEGSNERGEGICYVDDEERVDILEHDISDHKIESEHDSNIEDCNKIGGV